MLVQVLDFVVCHVLGNIVHNISSQSSDVARHVPTSDAPLPDEWRNVPLPDECRDFYSLNCNA